MSDQHAPGPWRLYETSPHTVYGPEPLNGAYLELKNPADARLIASAPALRAQNDELREALRALVGDGTGFKGWLPEVGNTVSRTFTEAEWERFKALLARHPQEKETGR